MRHLREPRVGRLVAGPQRRPNRQQPWFRIGTTAATPFPFQFWDRRFVACTVSGVVWTILGVATGVTNLNAGQIEAGALSQHQRERQLTQADDKVRQQAGQVSETPPNIILILCDNLGYGDVGCYGSRLHRTPHVDRLAAEGTRFTHCYSSSGVCSPSRASLMTGCYPRRLNLHQNDRGGLVLQPVEPIGLNPDELTMAELVKSRGYATALFGKWHLGDQPPFLPTRQGFDEYLGIPYSDDMTAREGQPWPPLPLVRNEQVIEAPVDRNLLTKRYTQETIRFITEHQRQPFFIMLAHAMPGSTTSPFASESFRGRSANGPWGDAVEEIDASTGEILAALARMGLDQRTLVIWTSDNGAPQRNPPQGSNAPLGGWGYSTAEGGMRIPCIARWPGRIPAGRVCEELVTLMDWWPTFGRLAGATLPAERAIDGRDIGPLLTGVDGAKSPHQAFYYYDRGQLQAVRAGPWKLYLAIAPLPRGPMGQAKPRTVRLINVVADPGETKDLASAHRDIVEQLQVLANEARAELGDGDRTGRGQRPCGRVERPVPLVLK